MEAKKSKNLSVRLRRLKPSSTSSTSTSTASEVKSCTSSSGKNAILSGSSSDSDSDDFATVHFKLAAALEAAAAHAPGLRFDWQSMKTALMSGVTASCAADKSKEASATNAANQDTDPADGSLEDCKRKESKAEKRVVGSSKENPIFVPFNPTAGGYESSSGTSISSDEDDDVSNILLPLFSKPLAAAMQFSKLTSFAGIVGGASEGTTSVLDDANPLAALSKILDRMPFNPFDADLVQVQFVFKSIVSLTQLSLRENNEIEVEIKKSSIVEYSKSKKDRALSPFMDVSNIHVKHSNDEFFTFCSCKKCLEYREIVFHIMMEQFKAAHMVVMLLDVLIKAYGPMLKNVTAYNKFEKLLDANKEIYWITCGFIYSKKAEHLDFIYDESLSDNMILVLFSSILMANNPILLLQILSFHVECIVKAYAEGFMEIVEPDKSQPNKTPAEEMLTYILDGYDDLCRISDHISSYLYAFENDFLQRISLTWTLLCQRLYQQHVFMNLTDTMLGCIITLKEDELTSRHAALIKKYIQFDDKMNYVDRCWTKAWVELNKVNLSERERKRRKCLLDVYHIFDTVVQDAIAFSLQESGDDNDFYDFQSLEDRRLAWQNIMAYTKMKWPEGFFQQPNMLVCDDKCKNCYASLEYHQENCKCITCSIAGGPLPPKRNADSTCHKCLTHSLVDKEMNLYESKILNVCASDDFMSFVRNNRKHKATMLEELGEEMSATLSVDDKCTNANEEGDDSYHISWAVYKHFSNRKRYRHTTLEERFFCRDCISPACLLARKILNNEISRELSVLLIHYYQPLVMSREELRSTLPNIMLYNRKMVGSNVVRPVTDMHDFIVKNYWTFIISLYATYFLELDEKCPLNLSYFDVSHNDIGFRIDYKTLSIGIHGNKEDRKFLDFLDKIKSLSPYKNELVSEIDFTVDVHTEEFQNKLGHFMNLYEKHRSTPINEKVPRLTGASTSGETMSVESNAKKNCKERAKKCCFDHPDLGDHCKENHTGKKRMKKECNHARMNETRDRLRKKLSQLVNARKNIKITGVATDPPDSPTEINIKQPPSLKSAATAAAANKNVNVKVKEEDDSLECLNSLCKRISHLHTCKSSANDDATVTQQSENKYTTVPDAVGTLTAMKQSSSSSSNNSLMKDVKTVSSCPTAASNNNNNIAPTHTKRNGNSVSITCAPPPTSKLKDDSSWDVASEIYEFIDNYSKDQSKVKKWINETLSYIEGSSGMGGSGKKQPQPTNPKKAAKKAKQKQRKEEEKRITELQDLRAQFSDIYFKEFADKLELKALKASKKRDKRKIAELEVNVKKLQRAKGKVETAILELIATVKQTNVEFKFSYLPTKEQQVAKMKELEANCTAETAPFHSARHTPTLTAAEAVAAVVNNLNVPPPGNYTLPYAHANHFPYHPQHPIDFPGAVAGTTAYGMIRPPLPTPMCYAPTQHQQLSPEVVAAMAANAACNSSVDPSKRIVTIRRVNLPNVPEPQVTVTAKGSSPDKDKLLYTFVNGQLVQTSTAIPSPPMTQLSLPMQRGGSAPPEQLIAIPLPPLSKTQIKKERRRLAKFSDEEAQTAAERQRLEEEAATSQHMRENEAAAKSAKIYKEVNGDNNKSNKKQQQKLVAENQKDVKIAKSSVIADDAVSKLKTKKLSQQQQRNKLPNSTTTELDISKQTADATRRSASTTTSCSVGTSSDTATPVSSEVNTRDNSVCSQKPTVASVATTISKKEKVLQAAKAQQMPKQVQKPQQQQQVQVQQNKPEASSLTQKVRTPSPVKTAGIAATNPTPIVPKRPRTRRGLLPDNGQFDNNPFKTLHMHDSDSGSEWDSTVSYGEDDLAANIQGKAQKQFEKVEPKPKRQEENKTKTPAVAVKVVLPKKEPIIAPPQIKSVQREAPKRITKLPLAEPQRSTARPSKLEGNSAQRGTVAPRNKQGQQQQQREPQRARAAKSQSKPDNPQQRSQQPLAVGKSRSDGRECRHSGINNNKKRGGGSRGQNVAGGVSSGTANSINTQPQSRTSNSRHSNRHAPSESAEGKPLSKRAQKQAQRSKKFQQQHHNQHSDCCSGIPQHMGYFNPNDVAIPHPPTPHAKQYKQQPLAQQQQQTHYNSLTQQMQGLRVGQQGHSFATPSYASVSNNYASSSIAKKPPLSANVSIMDQLNRGVQVENLSLPPGITLTKVDPAKSEQLRQKSESIKKLSKPLQAQAAMPQTAFQHSSGATIIAPPVGSVSNYYGAPYAGVAASALDHHQQSGGIIMVEANPPAVTNKCGQSRLNVAAAAAAASASNGSKTSRSKKRRNKAKSDGARGRGGGDGGGGREGGGSRHNSTAAKGCAPSSNASSQPEMITLRNPMFHGGPIGAAATILQQPSLIPARPLGGLPLPASLPMDQPAAIIKNENGMFTIRNPALHQAVTNGLALGGYRQFGNVNYYTPQEAAAEAARATQMQQQQHTEVSSSSAGASSSFSYFSSAADDAASQVGAISSTSGGGNSTHKTISISCTSIGNSQNCDVDAGGGGLTGHAAVISRPTPQQKCISAIGSEIKSAQQQKQKCKESQQGWTNFGSDLAAKMTPLNSAGADNLICSTDPATAFLGAGSGGGNGGAVGLTNAALQEKYQQSSYYNGFNVFPAKSSSSQISSTGGRSSNTGSLFDGTDCHMHHSCGDDSPPPTITGYTGTYLEGIPNTGVIRYDDASFLKHLIPGQNLNNEVSIHNVSDSNFARNSTSPVAHRVEITPVYTNRPTSANMYEQCSTPGVSHHPSKEHQQQQQVFASNVVGSYRENLPDFGNDSNIFVSNNLLNLNDLNESGEQESEPFKPFNYDFESTTQKQKLILHLNDLLLKKNPTVNAHSQRTSPYLDESVLDDFVQNMTTLQISTPVDEQCSQLNGRGSGSGGGAAGGGGSNNGGNCSSNGDAGGCGSNSSGTTNGWW